MQINVTVGNSQYIGFKSVDSQLYYQQLVAQSTVDSAINANSNTSYGLIGVTYKPVAANIGQWTTFKAGKTAAAVSLSHVTDIMHSRAALLN